MGAQYPLNLSDKLIDWTALADAGGETLIAGQHVVEAGPGYGLDAFAWASLARRYVALDSQADPLDRAALGGAEAVRADFLDPWPEAAQGCDLILDFSSLDDTGEPLNCYPHAVAALRVGGRLLTSFANAAAMTEAEAAVYGAGASHPVALIRELRRLGMRTDRLWNETGARAVIMTTKLDLPKNPPVEVVRRAWVRASQFPGDKEAAYPRGLSGETGHTDAQEFEAQRGKRVLEYGCGGGSDTLSYLRRGCDVTYVDITPENVDTTRAYAAREGYAARSKGIVLEESDRIPMPSGIFEVANAHGVLHHIPRADLVLWELRRLLKPGGLLFAMLYTEHLEARYAEQIAKTMEAAGVSREEAMCWCFDGHGSPWARTYTGEQGETLLNEHGFKLLEVREYNVSTINDKPDFRTFKAMAT